MHQSVPPAKHVHDRSIMLKIGDFVSFHFKDGVIEGQGVLDDFVGLSTPSRQFADSVFQIGVRNRVAAATDFEDFKSKHSESARAQVWLQDSEVLYAPRVRLTSAAVHAFPTSTNARASCRTAPRSTHRTTRSWPHTPRLSAFRQRRM